VKLLYCFVNPFIESAKIEELFHLCIFGNIIYKYWFCMSSFAAARDAARNQNQTCSSTTLLEHLNRTDYFLLPDKKLQVFQDFRLARFFNIN
jgi:hypothetical protein